MVSKPNIGDTGWGVSLNAALDSLDTAVGQRLIAVDHGATAGTARPTSTLPVKWFGTVAPTNGVLNDEWYDRTNEILKRYDGSTWQQVGRGTYASILTPAETLTYNPDGTVATETINGVTTTYTYNTDGTVATETRAGVTRTYTYNSGALVSVA